MKIHQDKSSLSNLKSQLAFYEELVSQKEGYPSGVRTVLNKSKKIFRDYWYGRRAFSNGRKI